MLTTGQDTFVGTSGNDTFTANTAVVVDPTNGAQSLTDTLQVIDNLDGGAGVDTLKIVSATGVVALPSLTSVEVIEAQSQVGLTLDTSAVNGLTNLNVTKVGAAGVVAATAGATTDVSVAMKAAGAAVGVVGGNNVTVKLTDVAAAADVVTIGTGTAAKGNVVVEMTGKAYAASDAAHALSAINVTGGKTISVTQKAASNTAAAAADTTNVAVTQGAVSITGNADTTTVTVKQDAAVGAKNAAFTTGGVTESASVKFGALKATDTLAANGLTFTASVDMTAAEVAAVFASLVNGTLPVAGDTQGSGLAGKGTYTGAFVTTGANGWTSAAASGDTVVFTAATANTNVAANLAFTLVGTGTAPVVTTTEGKAHDATATGGVMGVVAGAVTVADAAGTIKTVTVDGYSVAGSALTGGAVLDTLNLSNGGAFTSANAAATLNLTLEKVNGLYTQTAGAATLNVKSVGANTAGLAAANTTALNVSGTGLLNASTASVLTALKTITVTETAGLNLGATALANVVSVDTTGTTGAVTVAIDGSKASYAGGAGVDSVTVTTAAVDKAINLGAGNDSLNLSAATPVIKAGLVLEGGDGTDTLVLAAADAAALSGAVTFETQINGFEKLEVGAVAAATTVNLDNMDDINYVISNGSGAFAYKLDKMLNNATVELKAAHTNGIEVALKDTTGTADVVNLIANAADTVNIGTVTVAGVETINVTAKDTVTGAAVSTNTLTVKAAAATTVNVTDAGNLSLILDAASTKVNLVDASSATGALTFSTLDAVATTVNGGAGNDVLTATGSKAHVLNGGAGSDTLVANAGLTTLTGGAGNDLFVVGTASIDVNSYATITDFAAGDLLQLVGADSFASAKVTLGDTAVFQDYANAAMNVLVNGGVGVAAGWFQFGGNTYVVADVGAESTAFVNSQDFVVKLTGLVDLSQASFNNTSDTIALV